MIGDGPDVEHRFCDEEEPHVIPDECWHLFASPSPAPRADGTWASSTDGMSDEVWKFYLDRAYAECGLCFTRPPLRGSDVCYPCRLELTLESLR